MNKASIDDAYELARRFMERVAQTSRSRSQDQHGPDSGAGRNVETIMTDPRRAALAAKIKTKVTRLMEWELERVIDAVLDVVDSLPPPKKDEKRYLVKNNAGRYLVSGSINGKKYDGEGKAYGFTLDQAKLMEDCFGFTYEPAL